MAAKTFDITSQEGTAYQLIGYKPGEFSIAGVGRVNLAYPQSDALLKQICTEAPELLVKVRTPKDPTPTPPTP
jgi:hypothetical protein